MLDFWEYLDLDQLLNEDIEDHQPLNGGWQYPLNSQQYAYVYRYDVPGDICNRCYAVRISGDPKESIGVTFNRDDSYADQHRGVGADVFKGVLKALSEYLAVHSPKQIEWSAVSKGVANPRTGRIQNPQARDKVYEHWALRNLFPKYIGMQGTWIRKDVYDDKYVSIGYPPVPEKISSNSPPAEKRRVFEDMKEKAAQNRDEINRRRIEQQEAEYRRQREEAEARERAHQELLQQKIEDPNENPLGLKKDDIVYHTGENPHSTEPGQITDFKVSQDGSDFRALVYFSRNEDDDDFAGRSYYISPLFLRKQTPEDREARIRQREERRAERLRREEEERAERLRREEEAKAALLSDPAKNPYSLKEGDEVITWVADRVTKENGLIGRIREISVNYWITNLVAKIDWSDEAKEVLQSMGRTDFDERQFNIEVFRKATPETIAEIRRKMREIEINHRLNASRENWQARARRAQDAIPSATETSEEILNHPNNPLHLKIGDLVRFTNPPRYGRNSRRTNWSGIISDLKIYGSHLVAYVKFHGSNSRPIQVWNLNGLVRDDSPETQTHIARQQARQRRAQRAIGSTGGHQIGDVVTVLTGRHRGKSGHIVNFRYVGDNVSAIVTPSEGPDFSVNIRMLQPPASTPQPAAESFSFKDYLLYIESRINRI